MRKTRRNESFDVRSSKFDVVKLCKIKWKSRRVRNNEGRNIKQMLEIPFYNYNVKTQTLSKLYMVY